MDEQAGICGIVSSYFLDIFGVSAVANANRDFLDSMEPAISYHQNAELIREFTLEEFSIAIKQMHGDKAPGPDDFNPAFYHKCWPLVGEEIFRECVRWLSEGVFPTNLNCTNVVLIPKCESPQSTKDLHPISLCNVIYKILSKVLCNRLKKVLPELVDKAQSAFISGRTIQDNILIAFVTIHMMKGKTKGKKGDVALKIDISKAYNRVDWGYLRDVLYRLGFSST